MVDFLIDDYGIPALWVVGDAIYPNEPHNIQHRYRQEIRFSLVDL
jgi:hypothetical protein